MAHLARHARSDALPAHLRICQCHERGCRWHPRHRGCAGPVLLVLTREHGGRTWRLADTCAACAAATPHSAVVPDTAPTTTPTRQPGGDARPHSTKPTRRSREPSSQVRVQDMLSYLASALPTSTSTSTSPEARLLALQCALRANDRGQVRLPAGLLRGMRLQHAAAAWRELERHRWLHLLDQASPGPGRAAVAAQLLDPLTQLPGRPDRLRAADWVLRITSRPPLRHLAAGMRLAALALEAHHSPRNARAGVEADRLSRACGIDPVGLGLLLNQLLADGTITAWSCDPQTGDVRWAFPGPEQGPPTTPPPGWASD